MNVKVWRGKGQDSVVAEKGRRLKMNLGREIRQGAGKQELM